MRTNWIITAEKRIGCLNLAGKIGNHDKFKKATKYSTYNAYVEYWKTQLRKPEQTRLEQTNLNKQDWIFIEK